MYIYVILNNCLANVSNCYSILNNCLTNVSNCYTILNNYYTNENILANGAYLIVRQMYFVNL